MYYFVVLAPGPFEHVDRALREVLEGNGLHGAAQVGYRKGEELRTRLGLGNGPVAKTVRLEVGSPIRGEDEITIPLTWEATGAPDLFPRMEADLVLSALGPDLTHLAFRGSYRPPLGRVGRALDRALLHRLAETSVKGFVDGLAGSLSGRIRQTPALPEAARSLNGDEGG